MQEYNIESAADIQEALKDLLCGTIKEMMEAEMDEHLGYAKSERSDSDDARDARELILRWIPPVFVRGEESTLTTIRQVKE